MKSYCIKTNNEKIIDYLLNKIEKIDFNNIYYCSKEFKIYKNVILHYNLDEVEKFQNFIVEIIVDTITKFYEDKIITRIINSNYFYFEEYEKEAIFNNCKEILEYENEEKIEILYEEINKYIEEHKNIILEGIVNFRVRKYIQYIDNIVDIAVNQYIIEKEYNEFISLLKVYINTNKSEVNILHLIYSKGESVLLDENKNIVSVSDNLFNAKYLSDISFSSNDFALNTLLSMLPKKIEIHIIDEEDEFINTLKLIFEDRAFICKDCNICKTYKMIYNAKILN